MASARPTVFIDSSAFFAFIDRDDASHARSLRIQQSLIARRSQLVTSNFVVAESPALILNRIGRIPAIRFLDSLEPSVTIVRIAPEDEERSVEIIRGYDDKDFSYVDASSFAVMERLNIDTAFTFDRHFVQFGFRTAEEP